jgi:putative copper export protein/mono/diheme cytochrome c family protein
VSELLATAKLIGVFLLLGAGIFRRSIRNIRNCGRPMISGATIFILAALAEILFLTKQPSAASVLPIVLAPVFVMCFLAGEALKKPVLTNLALMLGLTIAGALSADSHAAGEPGFLPVLSVFLHWVGAIAWGGCLIYLVGSVWTGTRRESQQNGIEIGRLVRRYAIVEIAALGLFVLSGGLLAFIHVHNADAMSTTLYGRFVIVKASLVLLLLLTASINLIKARQFDVRQFRRIVIVETVLLAGLLVTTAGLETRDPPGVPPFNNPKSWQMKAGEVPLTISLQPVGGSSTQVRIEIAAASADYRFDETARAFFDLETANGDAGERGEEAVWIGSSGFLGETVVAVPGEWRFSLRIDLADGSALTGNSVFALPPLPLKDDLKPFLSISAIGYSLPGLATFVVGVLLLSSSGWILRQCWLGKAYPWLMPVCMANMVLGGYLALSVTFVKTYPTTFWSNPEPYDVEVIRQGETVYREHCEECHGITGKGDGPWALEERGIIPDLGAPHMDVHTDGEVYWWIIKGIPSLDMPPLAEEISETDRWAVINFTRSLRHGLPAE